MVFMVIAPIPRGTLKKMDEEKFAVDFRVLMSACAASCGFQNRPDSKIRSRCWLWLVRRRDLGRSLFSAVFPEFIAREKPGLRVAGCQGRSAGLVRPAAVGEDSALRALTARNCGLRSREKAMNLGKDEQRLMGQGLR